jgi:aminomethyltransferase
MAVRDTPLAAAHRAAGAHVVEFAGWRLPLRFTSVAEEARAARTTAALFDISHMGLIHLVGPHARPAARRLLTRDTTSIPAGASAYALLCSESGGILDDLFVMVESDGALRLVVNAANHDRDIAWLRARLSCQPGCRVEDLRGDTFGLALQGPKAEKIVVGLGTDQPLPALFATFAPARMADADVILSRTGYTGEDGFEVFGSWRDGPAVWEALMQSGRQHGLVPAGLAARDVLRQEMGYPLWGQDIGEDVTPLEAGLGWAIDWAGDFVGRAALEKAEPKRRRIGLTSHDRGVPRPGDSIHLGGHAVGEVTSGTYSHNLGAAVAQGYVEIAAQLAPGVEVETETRGRRLKCRVESFPFLPKRTRKSWAEGQGRPMQ